MTVATSFTREMNVTRIILRAYNLAGLLAPEQGTSGPTWTPRDSLAKDFLQSILDELQTEGVFTREVDMVNVSLTAGDSIYDMPDNVWDVVEDGAYIAAGEDIDAATSETPVLQKDREAWQRLGTKSSEGRPTMFWVDRTASPVQVILWPIPEEAGTIRFQAVQLFADVTSGTKTLDLERYWMQYILWELAHQLCVSANKLEHGGYCAQQAQAKRERGKAASNQHTPNQMVLMHRTGWN